MGNTGTRYNWTDEFKEKLKREYGPYGAAPKFSHETGIAVSAIYKMAESLGLKKQPKGWYIHSCGHKVVNRIGSNGMLEHRKNMEDYLGRKLNKTEIVHHIDGNKLNNSIDNLVLVTRSEHINIHRDELLEARDDIVRHFEESEITESLVI